jgi:hypothetical protein
MTFHRFCTRDRNPPAKTYSWTSICFFLFSIHASPSHLAKALGNGGNNGHGYFTLVAFSGVFRATLHLLKGIETRVLLSRIYPFIMMYI